MKNIRHILSIALGLCLVLSVSVCAFAATADDLNNGESLDILNAGDEMSNNYGSISINNGVIKYNRSQDPANQSSGSVWENYGTVIENHGLVAVNFGEVSTNCQMIESNNGKVVTNHSTIIGNNSDGCVEENHVRIELNMGTVNTNLSGAVIEENDGKVEFNDGAVRINYEHGIVNNSETGIVEINLGGIVNGGIVKTNYYNLSSNIPLFNELDPSTPPLILHGSSVDPDAADKAPIMFRNPYNALVLDSYSFIVDIPEGYELRIYGDCVSSDPEDGTVAIRQLLSDIRLEFYKPTGSSVPATGDNSNMSLWLLLLPAFAAVAVLTRKKKA